MRCRVLISSARFVGVRRCVAAVVAVAALVAAPAAVASAASQAGTAVAALSPGCNPSDAQHVTCTYTAAGEYAVDVPARTLAVDVTLIGGHGGAGNAGGAGGVGARVSGALSDPQVSALRSAGTVFAEVAGNGQDGAGNCRADSAGGDNGGGASPCDTDPSDDDGGGGGGGASDLRLVSSAQPQTQSLNSRVAVAAGGGGGSFQSYGGAAGQAAQSYPGDPMRAGQPATQTTPGDNGYGTAPGSLGQGGRGNDRLGGAKAGGTGGGGAGVYGGGGGNQIGGGGGGGSSKTPDGGSPTLAGAADAPAVTVTFTLGATPAVTTQPTEQTVAAGQRATFTAAASGDPAPTVKWQSAPAGSSTYSDIAGATQTSYTTPAVEPAASGSRFRAVFTNVLGSTPTDAATLSVSPSTLVCDTQDNVRTCKATGAGEVEIPVPSNAIAIGVTLIGGRGGDGDGGGAGGVAARVSGQLSAMQVSGVVSAGSVFAEVAGDGQGAPTSCPPVVAGGVNGGGAGGCTGAPGQGGGGGGGASDVRTVAANSGSSLGSRLAVAAGGGGGASGGVAGGAAGQAGESCLCIPSAAGQPGTDTGPGNNGNGTPSGALGKGGDGETGAGGGGAGLFGGGGGALVGSGGGRFDTGGGGGGSSLAPNGGSTSLATASDAPAVTITFTLGTGPAVTAQPADQTVGAGQQATFTAATSGDPAPTVQWQSAPSGSGTFADIAGATDVSYTTPATVAGDNGTRFRAVFTNSQGSVMSDAATLTVTSVSSPPSGSAPVFGTSGVLPSGRVGVAYDAEIVVSGSPKPTLSVTAGSLPPGLAIVGDPHLAGTPTAAGEYAFTLTASNAEGSVSQEFSVVIAPAVSSSPTPTTGTGSPTTGPTSTPSIGTTPTTAAPTTVAPTTATVVPPAAPTPPVEPPLASTGADALASPAVVAGAALALLLGIGLRGAVRQPRQPRRRRRH